MNNRALDFDKKKLLKFFNRWRVSWHKYTLSVGEEKCKSGFIRESAIDKWNYVAHGRTCVEVCIFPLPST
jgi:hypothetical protein